MKKALVLFRYDLRVHDNETLLQASTEADEILCAYALQEPTNAFILEALHELKTTLKDLGVPLIVEQTTPQQLANQLTKKYSLDTIYTQEKPFTKEIASLNKPTKTYDTATLYNPQDLPIQPEDKQSFLRLTQNLFPPMAFAAPKELSGVAAETNPLPPTQPTQQELRGGESHALQLLDELLNQGGDATQLNAYLDIGCLSPRTVFYKALEQEQTTNQDTRALRYAIRERDYALLRE